jgi:alanine dehydrogenase
VVVLGAGMVGGVGGRVAARLGCDVVVLSRGSARLRELASSLAREGLRVRTDILDDDVLRAAAARADLVIGAVLEPGRLSPKLLGREHLRTMRAGSALVDVGIDQGGIAETSRMTTLANPTYVDEGIVHYAVPNMPALVARSATQALAAAVLPYVRQLARGGVEAALAGDAGLAAGAMVWHGQIVHAGLAGDTGRPLAPRPLDVAKMH